MNNSGTLVAFFLLATIFMVSCLESEKITGPKDESDLGSSSSVEACDPNTDYIVPCVEPSSSSVGISSSSVNIGSWLTCGEMKYLPADNAFCYVDECGMPSSCREKPNLDCPTVCVREEQLLQKCEGKEYDPRTHYCSRTGCMHIICSRPPCYDRCEKEELLELSSGLPKCDGKEYFPGTHFCYVNTCGRLPSCRENPDRPCPAVCYPEGKILERCGGKEYNPNTEVCYNGQNVICMNQIKNCGYSGVYTDCQGNNPVEIILDFYQTNCVPPVAY
ncbi:MAG: hypothetical protein FWC26_13660 [Fibromonadales bacterium]|nr:hypothetical protein [Fibromonadales bacterium]